MPTLHIQFENGDVHQIRAEGYVTVRELMHEYLRAKNVLTGDEKGGDWTTLHKRTNMALELDRTLDQHGLKDGDELYISRRGNRGEGADLKLDVTSPDGKNHHAEMPPDTATEELLTDLIEVWKLPAGSWELVDQQTGKRLDSRKTLAENGVVTGQRLYLKQPGPGVKPGNPCWRCQADVRGMRYCKKCGADQQQAPDLKVEVVGPDGRIHHAEMSPDTATEELLTDLIEVWKLPAGSCDLVDQQTGKRLDSKKTLAENGVVTGQRLYLSRLVLPPPQDLKLEVVDPTSKSHKVAIPRDTLTKKFLDDLIEAFRLPPDDWALWDEQRNKSLSPNRTLAENGVAIGQRLYLKQTALPPPRPRVPDFKLEVADPDGKRYPVEMPPDTRTEEFLKDLIKVFKLLPGDWMLWDQQRNKSLSPNKTLAENGVTTGQQLSLRKGAGWGWKKIALVVGLIALILLGIMIARHFLVPPVAVSLEPRGPVNLAPSGTQQFTATVKNGSHGVSWSISPEVGKISPSGMKGGTASNYPTDATYEAPGALTEPQTVKVVVRSVDDSTKTASAEIVLVPGSPPVSVSPSSVTLGPGNSAQFAADTEVNWSLDPAVGTITPEGIYTAPQELPADQTVAVVATRKANSASSGRATISLTSGPLSSSQVGRVIVSPSSVALDANGRFQFRATLPTAGDQVVWSLNPTIGQISEQGLYTAPSSIKHDRSVTVTANTNSAGPGTATIRLKAVALTPIEGPGSVRSNESATLRTSVVHSPNNDVRWTIDPQVGSISPQGIYTPPAAVAKPVDVTVIATSQADPSKSTPPFVIHVIPSKPQIAVTLNHYNNVMHESEEQKLSATVTGTPNTAVTFSISGAGTLVPDGNVNNIAHYTAPNSIPLGGIRITITAVSNADPTKFAIGYLRLERAKQ